MGMRPFTSVSIPIRKSRNIIFVLFARIREEKIKMECFFESFGLPTVDFIRSFKETFPGPKSLIALSPDVGSERTRRMHKGYAYTNQALMKCLDEMEAASG